MTTKHDERACTKAEAFLRLPCLFRRWEFEQVIEGSDEVHISASGMGDDADALARAVHVVASRWIPGRQNAPDVVSAVEDVEDLASADCLVSFTEYPTQGVPWAARGGRHVEFGIALASGKRLSIVGP